MSIAVLEQLSPVWYTWLTKHRIGILRIYATNNISYTCEPYEYKFFTVVDIHGTSAKLLGLSSANVTTADLRSIIKCLKDFNVSELYWTHHNKIKRLTI